jgi:hypothetical protein
VDGRRSGHGREEVMSAVGRTGSLVSSITAMGEASASQGYCDEG